MSQQAMILLKDHNYIVSQPLDYKLDMFSIRIKLCRFTDSPQDKRNL